MRGWLASIAFVAQLGNGGSEKCDPSYLSMGTDYGGHRFHVVVQGPSGPWDKEYWASSPARCDEIRAAVIEVLEKAGAKYSVGKYCV